MMTEQAALPERRLREPKVLREPPPPGGGEIVAIDDVENRYVDEWVIMRITAYNEDRWPSEGYLIAHHPTEDGCWDMFNEAVAAGEPRLAPHYIFVAGPTVRTGAEMLAAMAQLEAEQPAARRACERVE